MKIDLSGIQETLLLPLWGRAKLSKKDNPVLKDPWAIELVENLIEYNFERLDKHLSEYSNVGWLVRARMFDDTIRRFKSTHSEATIVNLGAGLDTTFFRVDNGLIRWYDLDLPDVIEVRKKIISESERMKCIAKSLLDTSWMKDIKDVRDGILFFAGGVLFYFEEPEVKRILSRLADSFPDGEIVFDAISAYSIPYVNKMMKDAGLASTPIKWGINDTKSISKWDPRITILEDYPMYSRIKNKSFWGEQNAKLMDDSDRYRGSCIVHLRFRK
jgi:O-methyltransferase involved in polyketide biosynthesis